MGDYDWGQGAKGAAGGALAGAQLGSFVPGAGTLIGGIAGGTLGLLGGFGNGASEEEKANQKRLQDYYDQVSGRQAPQAGAASQSGYSGFRGNQAGLVSRLEAMANGQGPSMAREQFKAATDRNMANQQAMANSGRGGPLAAMGAANNMGMLGAQAAQGSAMGRVAEQQGAISQLGGVLNQGRSADESTNQFNAGQTNDMARANLDARLRQMGMDDQARQAILQQMGGAAQNQASRPGMGDQILAGGAGLYAMGASQNAQKAASGGYQPKSSNQQANEWAQQMMGMFGTPSGGGS